jgi:hypothetical protein
MGNADVVGSVSHVAASPTLGDLIMRRGTWWYPARIRDATAVPLPTVLGTAVACLAVLLACARAPASSSEQPAAATVFTDTAVHRRNCENTDSLPVDLSKCVLRDQGRDQRRPPPPLIP